MWKRINVSSNFFHPRVATPFQFFRTKRGGDTPTGTPLTGASNAGGVGKERNSGGISGFVGHFVFRCLQHIYRIADWSISWAFPYICTKLACSILMRVRNTGTQPNFQKTLSKSGILSPKKLFSLFFAALAANLQLCQKSINDVTDIWAMVTWYAELRSRDTHINAFI